MVLWRPLFRESTDPFSDSEVALIETFATQVVIAVENVRQFREVQSRTAEVEEALEQQTATSEVLEVISNSVEDTQPVFEKILDSCQRVLPCQDMTILTLDEEGLAHLVAQHGSGSRKSTEGYRVMPVQKTVIYPAIQSGKTVLVEDCATGSNTVPALQGLVKRVGNFSALTAPMMWKNKYPF